MPDNHTPQQRSDNMRAVRGKNTAPELLVRSMLHRLGYRFRLHRKDLPGTPLKRNKPVQTPTGQGRIFDEARDYM
jgi:DNA mismatch endonuclease Vsr